MKLKVGFRKISLKTCTSVEPVSESGYCQIGMAAIAMDVNTVYTLECAYRRQLLAARALSERSLLIRTLPFPRTKTIGDAHIDDLVILSVSHRPSKCSEPMLRKISSRCLRMRARQAVRTREKSGEDGSTAFRTHSDSLLNAGSRSRSSRC